MYKRILGNDWTLRQEVELGVATASGLRSDRFLRIATCCLTVALIWWVGLHWTAILWCIAVFMNEGTETLIVNRLSNKSLSTMQRLIPYFWHISSGSVIWASAGCVLWFTGDPASMLLGITLLIGTLVHVSVFYASSRLQTMLTMAPIVLLMAAVLISTTFATGFSLRSKTLIAFSLTSLFLYVVTTAFQSINVQEKLRAVIDDKARMAGEDPLTGLHNRRAFLSCIDELMAREKPYCVLFVDLDRFKPINDEHGHSIGDQVLREIAHRLGQTENALCVARFGGDEFAVVVRYEGSDLETRASVDTVYEAISTPIQTDVGDLYVGVSIGYAIAPIDGTTAADLLHAADTAMRRAKSERGGVSHYDPSVDSGARSVAWLENSFRSAVVAGGVKAALQPIARSSDYTVLGYELLARWPNSGFPKDPTPNEFIPIAEKYGLLNSLLWETLRQALPVITGTSHRIAINVSPSQLGSTRFFARLASVLAQFNVDPSQIELEITEEIAVRNIEESAKILNHAKSRGFTIALDDFGTGYSSLSMLDALPLDKLKLDRTFVQRAQARGDSSKVLAATIQLARQLGIVCCVEGIEDQRTAELVTRYGCDQLQGYWIGRPLLAKEYKSDLRRVS
ncbi:MAG: EAL domain-containing protein [Pseudomonadota bacterium]